MGGGGSIQGMITSLRNNKNQLRGKRMFRKDKSFLGLKKEYLKAAEGKIDLKHATKEQLLSIRTSVLKARRKESYITNSILTILFITVSIFIYFQIKQVDNSVSATKQNDLKQKTEAYLALIADGDMWLTKGDWYNAIFQYKKAKEIFPKEYDINYRLVATYSYRCEREFLDCNKAKNLLNELLALYPKKMDLLKLK